MLSYHDGSLVFFAIFTTIWMILACKNLDPSCELAFVWFLLIRQVVDGFFDSTMLEFGWGEGQKSEGAGGKYSCCFFYCKQQDGESTDGKV